MPRPDGKATAFSLFNLEPRGVMFSKPGQQVYNGMIIGEHSKEGDMEVRISSSSPVSFHLRASLCSLYASRVIFQYLAFFHHAGKSREGEAQDQHPGRWKR